MRLRRGYTLLEVLVALAILMVALVPLVQHLFGGGASSHAQRRLRETLACEDRLSQLVAPGMERERRAALEDYPRCSSSERSP